MKITCFLPCRKGSERIPNKNIRPFSSYRNGLIEIKLKQLSKVKEIDSIVLSTNDEEIIRYAESTGIKNLIIHRRAEELSSSQTSTDDLVNHARSLVNEGHILWTHVTSPFLNSDAYKKIILSYKEGLSQGYDSLMTTSLIQSFVWNERGPINYDRSVEKWPRTQTLIPLHEVNSAVFLSSVDIYTDRNDRIGENPKLYSLNKIEGHDIDWSEDFEIAESLIKAKIANV
ncbi:acylneuraminate cytidylyltransferase [Anaerobacillus alkalidiazotrophicus]|uniref:Acylneuraminate cytidylyltransferase n=1 Tax=Anaerobacillus alkalidiazotrophicus TaxID=472963 RepID=A0A1S2MAI6_9BACI|nr:acylneuraminate cytidylyltransferase family protein [Anaerobacillus alkalidiazotrophicus]OIJ21719.1 acylneuraminate cytidylyltransferase [Anaerobacillus alkalidiazotrophicus]